MEVEVAAKGLTEAEAEAEAEETSKQLKSNLFPEEDRLVRRGGAMTARGG